MNTEDEVEVAKSIISPRRIYDEVSKNVVGQHEAKKAVANAVFLHFVRFCQSVQEEIDTKKSNLLLMGPTGCGKTYIVRESVKAIRKLTGYEICPLLEVDCTELTGRGWEGDSLTDHIKEHHKEYKENENIFNTTVVFLDEFDKLCKSARSSGGHDPNKLTQYNLLKTIEGVEIKVRDGDIMSPKMSTIRTHQFLFILAGNFSEVRAERQKKEHVMGFRSATEEEKFVDMHTEVENAGMVTQLVGRTPHIAELFELQPNELSEVLDKHLIPEMAETWKFLNKEIEISGSAKEKMVQNCFKRKTGARGLQSDLAKYLEDDIFDAEFEL